MRSIAFCALLAVTAPAAFADTAESDACKANLSPIGQEIYATALAENIDLADGKEVLTHIVEKLVDEGKLSLLDAKAEGDATAKCLELLE